MSRSNGGGELGGDGQQAWADHVAGVVRDAGRRYGGGYASGQLLAAPDNRTPHLVVVDWIGLPLRPVDCLTPSRALDVLDGSFGGQLRPLQEEYLEWRVVRDGDDPESPIRRVELTTELAAYWQVLAGYNPQSTLELIAGFRPYRTHRSPRGIRELRPG